MLFQRLQPEMSERRRSLILKFLISIQNIYVENVPNRLILLLQQLVREFQLPFLHSTPHLCPFQSHRFYLQCSRSVTISNVFNDTLNKIYLLRGRFAIIPAGDQGLSADGFSFGHSVFNSFDLGFVSLWTTTALLISSRWKRFKYIRHTSKDC